MGQVLLFLAAVNSVPWALYFLLRDQAAEGEVWALFAWLLPTVWSPTIVALLLTRWADGPTGIREALGRLRYPRDGVRWLAIAAAVPATATATAVFVARAAGEGAPFIPLVAVPFVVAMQCLTGAVGEELGWRGFLLPRLRKRYGRLPPSGQPPVSGVCGTSPRSSSQACRSSWCHRYCFFFPWPSQESSWVLCSRRAATLYLPRWSVTCRSTSRWRSEVRTAPPLCSGGRCAPSTEESLSLVRSGYDLEHLRSGDSAALRGGCDNSRPTNWLPRLNAAVVSNDRRSVYERGSLATWRPLVTNPGLAVGVRCRRHGEGATRPRHSCRG